MNIVKRLLHYFKKHVSMTKLYNWVKSNAKKEKKNSGRIEYRDNKSAKFPRVPKNSILEGGEEKRREAKKNIEKKKKKEVGQRWTR